MVPVLIVGCGDIGRRVGALWRQRGVPVTALTRRPDAQNAADLDWRAVDLDAPLAPHRVAGRLVYYFAPPPPQGTVDTRLRRWLAAAEGRATRLVYLGTSGVYGDCGGAWVDESRSPAPATDRGRRRLDAEHACEAWARRHDVPLTVLRVSAIYGPGRLPIGRLQRGEPVVRAAEAPWTNRIHADDLATACMAAADAPPGIYNVSDDHPGTLPEYLDAVADRLGLPRPPQISLAEALAQASPARREYLRESRRLCNRRLHDVLGVRLAYPSLAEGLRRLTPE
ncbi:NAD-dependent epimerase/dehydratase family protein [Ectothiorhodospiraceae bacterium 2226]|nr:NAD-dependent epimerase/dehydratase family protein [Ectothiorhodospiraceae bacterium 2226]